MRIFTIKKTAMMISSLDRWFRLEPDLDDFGSSLAAGSSDDNGMWPNV